MFVSLPLGIIVVCMQISLPRYAYHHTVFTIDIYYDNLVSVCLGTIVSCMQTVSFIRFNILSHSRMYSC